jgi:hypothetical protein
MPLILAPQPDECLQAFKAGLNHLVQLGRVPADLTVDPNPHPICVLGYKAIAEFCARKSVPPVAWRYFATNGGAVVVGDISATSPPTIANLQYGDAAQSAFAAAQALAKLAPVQANEYEPWMLRIPGALIDGFWLKPCAKSEDLIVPCERKFGNDPPHGQPINIDGFFKALRPTADQALRKDRAAKWSK